MNVFAIADLHLSSTGEKPMDIFGPAWVGHYQQIEDNWRRLVAPGDLVLLPGDLSWALRLEDAAGDLALIESLPGEKVFIQGNHDYWFTSPAKVRAALGPHTHLVRFDAGVFGRLAVCGTRGWTWPGSPEYKQEEDEKYWNREVKRLALSLDELAHLEWDTAVAMLHYPPLDANGSSEMCQMISAAGVRYAVYGHLHGEATKNAFDGERDGVVYKCVSADKLNFSPALVLEHPRAS